MAQRAIPPGYTFLNLQLFMSCKGKTVVDELFRKSGNRNPDAFDMYIYNDYYAYACLDLIDKTLTTIHSKIAKKHYDEAYGILEGLTIFNELDSSWLGCDDGERVGLTNKVYGASVVALLRGIDTEGRLNPIDFPSLEGFLKRAAQWGEDMKEMSGGTDYDLVCKAIGRRLFVNKSEADFELEKARLREFAETQTEDQRIEMEKMVKKIGKSDPKEVWFAGGDASDEHDNSPDLILTRVWREYKAYLQTVPKNPQQGPGLWDINKWSDAERAEFAFDAGSGGESGEESAEY